MPTYDFQCGSCGKVFEAKLGFASQGKGPACPECKSTKAQKIFSTSVNIITDKARLPLKDVSFNPKSGGGCCGGGGCGCR